MGQSVSLNLVYPQTHPTPTTHKVQAKSQVQAHVQTQGQTQVQVQAQAQVQPFQNVFDLPSTVQSSDFGPFRYFGPN